MRILHRFLAFCFLLPLVFCHPAYAQVVPAKYGVTVAIDSLAQRQYAASKVDSMVKTTPMFNPKVVIYSIEREHIMIDKTVDFYLLLLLCLMLGFMRFADPKYFDNLWRAFRNPGQGRAAREQLELSAFPNLVMNVFFVLVAGAYLLYIAEVTTTAGAGNISQLLLVLMLMAGIALIYTVKYFAVRFTGWAFKIEDISESYIFNIFLINKITAIGLFPFVLILAFASPILMAPAIILSAIMVVLLLVIRYIRSWQVFGSFFHYSKFHFFTYLCASEILPLAVLLKLLVRGLLY